MINKFISFSLFFSRIFFLPKQPLGNDNVPHASSKTPYPEEEYFSIFNQFNSPK